MALEKGLKVKTGGKRLKKEEGKEEKN